MNKIRVLSNGIRVVSEKIPYLKSVSIGVWIGNGSAFEKKEENGISHFIEHMLFKGTNKRSARDITLEMDSVGGRLNAFTAREYTCFYTKTLDSHAPLAIDILSDMLYNSTFAKKDIDLERRVIFEEIDMCTDDPEEVVTDLIMEAAYGDTSMGRTILGTKESLSQIDSFKMKDFLKTHYTSKNTVIAISGNFDDSLFELLEEFFGKRELLDDEVKEPVCKYESRCLIRSKDVEQVQLITAFNGIDNLDERVYPMLILNNVFGEGMSSRLFQNIREERGLVYSIYAYHAAYKDTGMFNISAGMNPSNLPRVCDLISKEINNLKKKKLSDSEIARAKEQLKGNYMLSYETPGSRMQSAGRALLAGKEILLPEEVLKKIDDIKKDEICNMIDYIFNPNTLSVAAVGPLDEKNIISLNLK